MHYDMSDGILQQVYLLTVFLCVYFVRQICGTKRVFLVSNSFYDELYPHAVGSPHDRQSKVNDIHNPSQKFDKFRNFDIFEGEIKDGDALFIPFGWWHQVQITTHSNAQNETFCRWRVRACLCQFHIDGIRMKKVF